MAETGAGERRRVVVEEGDGGRVDQYLAAALGLSRNRVVALILDGRVTVDGEPPTKSQSVSSGQVIEVEIPAPTELEAKPEPIPLDIVHQDEHLLVVNKQAGLVVHPAPGHPSGTLVNALLHHVEDLSGIGGKLRPGIVHRLDRDTSGLMAVAKSDAAHRGLSEALKVRTVRRTYLAAVWGSPSEDTIIVDKPVGRDPNNRKRMAVVADGRSAQSRFRRVESWRCATLCEVDLKTGRTHQIRVHAAAIGHPVVGDELYGAGRERGFSGLGLRWAVQLAKRTPRQFLHAHKLGFTHPVTGQSLEFEAPLPPDLASVREWAADQSAPPST